MSFLLPSCHNPGIQLANRPAKDVCPNPRVNKLPSMRKSDCATEFKGRQTIYAILGNNKKNHDLSKWSNHGGKQRTVFVTIVNGEGHMPSKCNKPKRKRDDTCLTIQCLVQAQQPKARESMPKLYDGNTILKMDTIMVPDSDETIELKRKDFEQGVRLSTSASGSQPSGNTKKDRILQAPSSNSKNKVEAHPRNVKSSLNKKNGTVHVNGSVVVQNLKKQDNTDCVGVNSNDCMSSDNVCVSNAVNVVKSRAKPKKNKPKKIFVKPTEITTTNEASGNQLVLDSESPKPVVKLSSGIWTPVARKHMTEIAHQAPPFRQLTAMASEHSSSGPALHEMTPVSLSSGLVPNPSPSTPFVPPSRSDWDLLFQPMFDESLNVDFHAPKVIAPILEAVEPEHAVSTGSPSSTTVDQDAPSPNVIHTIVHPDHQVSEHTSKWMKDHPLENIIGALERPVSTQLQLHEQALFCYYDAFLTSVKPKNYKEALTQAFWD
ncbi:hypothetical protein Tco_0466553 [Tanacetum coccineum]